jgi:hypothetical protein
VLCQTTNINHACAIGLVTSRAQRELAEERIADADVITVKLSAVKLTWGDYTGRMSASGYRPGKHANLLRRNHPVGAVSGARRVTRFRSGLSNSVTSSAANSRIVSRTPNGTSDPQIGWQTDTRPCRPNNQPSSVIGVSTELTAGFRKGTNACGAFKSNPSSGSMWPQCFDRTCSTVRSA